MTSINLFPFLDTAVWAIALLALCIAPLYFMSDCRRALRAAQKRLGLRAAVTNDSARTPESSSG